MSNEPIKPALTAEEWAAGGFDNGAGFAAGWNEANDYVWFGGERFVRGSRVTHGLAAVCLYGQPFGFSQEDVKQLRELLDITESLWDDGPVDEGWQSDELRAARAHCSSLVNRIAALLPPSDSEAK